MGVGGRKEMGALRSWSAPSPTRSAQVDRHNHLWRGRSAEAKAQEAALEQMKSADRQDQALAGLAAAEAKAAAKAAAEQQLAAARKLEEFAALASAEAKATNQAAAQAELQA